METLDDGEGVHEVASTQVTGQLGRQLLQLEVTRLFHPEASSEGQNTAVLT